MSDLPASDTGGVKPMNLSGRLVRERERLLGMTDEERAYRKQWLQDQRLSPNEPVYVPELERSLTNPIRRFYRFPLDALGRALAPVIGRGAACGVRYFTGKILMGCVGICYAAYYFKYCADDWTRRGGWKTMRSRISVDPGDVAFPQVSDRSKGEDYYSMGFDKVEFTKL